jgi:hypothetical protein
LFQLEAITAQKGAGVVRPEGKEMGSSGQEVQPLLQQLLAVVAHFTTSFRFGRPAQQIRGQSFGIPQLRFQVPQWSSMI